MENPAFECNNGVTIVEDCPTKWLLYGATKKVSRWLPSKLLREIWWHKDRPYPGIHKPKHLCVCEINRPKRIFSPSWFWFYPVWPTSMRMKDLFEAELDRKSAWIWILISILHRSCSNQRFNRSAERSHCATLAAQAAHKKLDEEMHHEKVAHITAMDDWCNRTGTCQIQNSI